MVAWSAIGLRNLARAGVVKTVLPSSRQGVKGTVTTYVPVRFSGHDNTINIRTSRFQYTKFKDLINLYLLVGLIPIGLVIGYCNIFIGAAKLIPTPEGYEPKHWEYYEHPITRFLARYVVPSQQEVYERNMHNIFVQTEKKLLSKLERKIENLLRDRQDYQSWYFERPEVKYVRKTYELAKENEEENAGQGPGMVY